MGVLGATGAVGQRFVQLLEGHPWFRLDIVTASGKSAGNNYGDVVNWSLDEEMPEGVREKKIEQIDAATFENEGIELIFSALPADIAKDVELNLASKGFKVFSNAGAYRMAQDVPLLVADINIEHLALVDHQKTRPGYIVTNPNCTVTGLATGLKPLHHEFGVKSAVVTTYQALSGAGYPGVPSLDIVGNIIPYIPNEEEKIEEECIKILGKLTDKGIEPSPLYVVASCARVPVRDGHLESVLVDLERDATIDDIKKALADYEGLSNRSLPTAPQKPVIVAEDESRPQPRFDVYNGSPESARGMSVTVGRMKKIANKIRFFLLVHNTIRGAAGCSIMNAELARVEGRL